MHLLATRIRHIFGDDTSFRALTKKGFPEEYTTRNDPTTTYLPYQKLMKQSKIYDFMKQQRNVEGVLAIAKAYAYQKQGMPCVTAVAVGGETNVPLTL